MIGILYVTAELRTRCALGATADPFWPAMVDDAKVDEVMLEMDADGEGSVELQEFLWWWKRAGKVYREKMTALKDELNDVKALFDEFDEDASGEIGATELRSLIAMLGVRMNEDELEDTMEELDKDGSGGAIAMLSR